MTDQHYTLGILAGGRGQRVGGADKGWLLWRATPLIEHQLARFGTRASAVLISANRELPRYQELPARTVTDLRPDFPGPLAGVEALMAACTRWPLVIVPCDTPLLPATLPDALRAGLAQHQVAVAFDGERQQHLCLALRDGQLLGSLQAYLDRGERSVHGWLAEQSVIQVPFHGDAGAFLNVNQLPDAPA